MPSDVWPFKVLKPHIYAFSHLPFRRSPQTEAQYCTVDCQNAYKKCISGTTGYGYNDVSAQNDCQVKVTKCYEKCNKKDNTYNAY
ncbi:1604_t:CDS:2 [Gigaspora rosea]|nr:1604_t:CDS:2 [Gigaspora rosea]